MASFFVKNEIMREKRISSHFPIGSRSHFSNFIPLNGLIRLILCHASDLRWDWETSVRILPTAL